MSCNYRLDPEADKDYAEAYAWYEDMQTGLGEQFIADVNKKSGTLLLSLNCMAANQRDSERQLSARHFPTLLSIKFTPRQKKFISAPSTTRKEILKRSIVNNIPNNIR